MEFKLHVLQNDTGEKIPVEMCPMSIADAESTIHEPLWQTDWTSDYISDERFEKYAMKTASGELIALAAYEILPEYIVVRIAYMESAPESNPTMTDTKKHNGIGRAIIAYGIKLSVDYGLDGAVMFEGKTTELTKYYVREFDALVLPYGYGTDAPPRLLIDGEASKKIIVDYLE